MSVFEHDSILAYHINLMKQKGLKKEVARSVILRVALSEGFADELNQPPYYTYLDLGCAMKMLNSGRAVWLCDDRNERVEIQNKDVLMAKISELLVPKWTEETESVYFFTDDEDKRKEIDERIDSFIIEGKHLKRMFDALSSRKGKWIPFLGFMAGQVYDVLKGEVGMNKTEKYCLIYDVIAGYEWDLHNTIDEMSNKEKYLAVNSWIESYNRLDSEMKGQIEEHLFSGFSLDENYMMQSEIFFQKESAKKYLEDYGKPDSKLSKEEINLVERYLKSKEFIDPVLYPEVEKELQKMSSYHRQKLVHIYSISFDTAWRIYPR
ncbi:MAG: hypothetical protein ACOX5T_02565 [Candidatus Cryptobacteroides sp.]|jgi:hypothetical protein